MAEAGIAERASRNGHDPDDRPARSLLGKLAEQVRRRIPTADLDERDPDYIRDNLPRMWLFARLWYRAEVRGLGNAPETWPGLFVANHTAGNVAPEASA